MNRLTNGPSRTLTRRLFMRGLAVTLAVTAAPSCGKPQPESINGSALDQKAIKKVREILNGVKGKDRTKRADAIKKLIKMGDSSITGLLDVLTDSDAEMRELAVWAIGEIVEQNEVQVNVIRALRELTDALADDSWQVREGAVFALEGIARKHPDNRYVKQIGPALTEMLNDRHPDVRKAAIWAIGTLKHVPAVRPLINLLKDEEMRYYAVASLVAIGEEAAHDLVQALDDENIRNGPASVLVKIGPPAVPYVMESLDDEKAIVRKAAVWTLGMIGDKRALPEIQRLAENDPDEMVKVMSQVSLAAISSK